jgi:exosortase/archaeosortase family protein
VFVLSPRLDIGGAAFAAAVAVLAMGPALWLFETWLDPAFASQGHVYFAVVAALAAWSASSGVVRAGPDGADRTALILLAATALVRLAGQVLAIDTIGALALVIDIYALARLARLDRRARAIAPLWLAAAFAFALPLERIIQRSVGFALQEVSARGACGVLSAPFGEVRCQGVRITVEGADVLVDLPCSGARSLIAMAFMFTALAALARPRALTAVVGAVLMLAVALGANLLRITLLASGVALGPERLGFDVMAQPWHDLAGLIAFAAAAPVLIWWARAAGTPLRESDRVAQPASPVLAPRWRALSGAAFLLIAAAVVSAPRRPIDIAPTDIAIAAPARISGFRAAPIPLTRQEQSYFEQYGGAAAKAAYGPFALMLARTTSPLRHLHAPDECLRGLGYRVEYLGLRFEPTPSASYRATAPDGRAYLVSVTFISDRGHVVASVSEAVWRWLGDRSTVWTSVHRIIPEDVALIESAEFEASVIAALDLPRPVLSSAMEARHAR